MYYTYICMYLCICMFSGTRKLPRRVVVIVSSDYIIDVRKLYNKHKQQRSFRFRFLKLGTRCCLFIVSSQC